MIKKKISVCIPTYEMQGKGHIFLAESFDVLIRQTFKDFDVVVSDNSQSDIIKNVCDLYKDKLNINYYKNQSIIKSMSSNTNNTISHATGDMIKILFQDDFLFSENSLQEIVDNFDLEKDAWLVTGCIHTKDSKFFYYKHNPKWNNTITYGKNTIGSPSVLTIKNNKQNPIFFDTNLKWLMDCDFYKKCYDGFGKPEVLNEINVSIRTGDHQITNTGATEDVRYREFLYMKRKYKTNFSSIPYIIYIFIRHYTQKIIRKFT